MKKKSTSKLAFFSLRILLGLFAVFIAFALASSHSIGDTSSCGFSAEANWPGADTPSPTQTPQLKTDVYWTSPFIKHPVLVFRECKATSLISVCPAWDPSKAYHVVVQDIRGSPDCHNTPTPFIGDLLYKFDQDDGHATLDGINRSSWSLGSNLAMQGASNGGIVSYLAAVNATPLPLRGIQTHFATG